MWIRANAQTEGRGRKGRHWVSLPGNLYTTLLITPDAPPAALSQLSFVASLAVYDLAVHVLGGDADLSLKWPNDVLLKGNKLSGILAETIALNDTGRVSVAMGCGVNLQHSPADTRYGATCLADHGAVVEPGQVWSTFIDALSRWLDVWCDSQGFDAIRQAWTDRSNQIGTTISLDLGGKFTSGRFLGLAVDGALMLENTNGTIQLIRAGDVLQSTTSEQ